MDVPATCPRCRALYHADCWVANDYRCAIYGCEPARAPVPLPPPVPVVLQPAPAPRASMGWVVFGVLLVSSLSRIATSGRNERPSWTPPRAPPVFTPAGIPADILIGESDRIAAPMLQGALPTDAEIRRIWRRDVGVAVNRLLEARTLLTPGEVFSKIDPRLSDLSALRMRLEE